MSNDQREKCIANALRVEVMIGNKISDVSGRQLKTESTLEGAISESEQLLLARGYELPHAEPSYVKAPTPVTSVSEDSWEDLLKEAEQSTPADVAFTDLLSEAEIQAVLSRHDSIGSELGWMQSLDRYELSLAVCAGIVAGLMDVLLVKTPAHPGFMGSKGADGGWLSNNVKKLFSKAFPDDVIRNLERSSKTPYDPATNNGLLKKIPGLGPRTHRYHSLGHDVVLGFYFGIRDILNGEFTAIDKYGKLIIQDVGSPLEEGELLIFRILIALKIHVGHLLSDVATPAGLPAPLMPLVSFLQFGKIGDKEYTIAEVARQMYRSGYDFRFFISSRLPVMTAGLVIQIGNFLRPGATSEEQKSDHYSARKLTVRRQRLIAHSVGLLINAGKVSVTKNPLAISWAQTLAFLTHIAPELHFLLHGREGIRAKMAEDEILQGFETLNQEIDEFLVSRGDFLIQL